MWLVNIILFFWLRFLLHLFAFIFYLKCKSFNAILINVYIDNECKNNLIETHQLTSGSMSSSESYTQHQKVTLEVT